MNVETKAVLRACTEGSQNGTMKFPEVVARLIAAGVERYHADLVRSEKTYYLPNGESECMAAHATEQPIASSFSSAGVDAAVRASQAGKITYPQFCDDIARAGCVGYQVSLVGRRAVYYGRTGESHIEPFPPAR